MTLEDLFLTMGYDHELMVHDVPVDVSELGWEIETFDLEKSCRTWSLIKHIVVKDETDSYIVKECDLVVSPYHKFWARIDGADPKWIEARDCIHVDIELLNVTGEWMPCTISHSKKKTAICDIEVEGTSCYFSNGVLSHNTLYGDPDTTPGGSAIPFHASVRVKLTSGNQIKGKDKGRTDDTKDDVIAIKVIATTIKNKVSSPRRKADFEIHFGVGIEEHEQLLDEVNRVGPITKNGYIISCGGNGAWKEFSVADEKTGEVIHQKKFTKNMFKDVLSNPVWRPFIDELLDVALIKNTVRPTLESEVEAEEEMAAETAFNNAHPVAGTTGA